MKLTFSQLKTHRHFPSATGVVIGVLAGWMLLAFSVGETWRNLGFDQLFRFGFESPTNQVVVILMDNAAYADPELGQSRERAWDRTLHARLLDKLAADQCPLVVLDIFFRNPGAAAADTALAAAMARLSNVVLAAEQVRNSQRGLDAAHPTLPAELFLQAARSNWGVAWLDADLDLIVRRHWPFPDPGPYPSLPRAAARLAGARLDGVPVKRWVRYYDFEPAWTSLSYPTALAKGPGYFRDKHVFIGNKPSTSLFDAERDEFQTPHIGWTGETVGGVEILATEFLNLMNDEALRRLPAGVEILMFGLTGGLLGALIPRMRRLIALMVALGFALVALCAAVALSQLTNFWFPWFIAVGGQLPCVIAWSLFMRRQPMEVSVPAAATVAAAAELETQKTIVGQVPDPWLPSAPEYELLQPPIGQGGFGRVWIARNAIGQWQALKAVYAANFGENRGPYEAEFKGLQRYKPVSEKHPGLMRIELISRMKDEGYFYYVMELGDALSPGWEQQPQLYRPRDLETLRKQAFGRRLPVAECLRIAAVLADALNFLHEQGLTHRDIKPSNVIFVNGRPKLADVGLVSDIRPTEDLKTYVGTPGYMPPLPEKPGTTQADIYALGMLLYVISTGRVPDFFPDLATTLMERSGHQEFLRLNAIVLKACQPELTKRYQNTAELLNDLRGASPEVCPSGN